MESQGYRATNDVGTTAPHPGAGGSPAAGQNDPERVKDELRREGQTAKDEAGKVAQQAKQHAGEAGRQVKDSARAAAEQTKRKATEYAEQARTRGVEMLDQQRHTAASQLHTVGEAVHRAADKFREDRDENIAGYVDAVADEVDRCARYLEQRDMGSLVRDTQRFARRNPEVFLGGMFFAGLALSRFLKASPPEREDQERYLSGDNGGSWAQGRDSTMSASSASSIGSGTARDETSGGVAVVAPTVIPTTPEANPSSMPGESGPACGPTV